MFLPTELDNIIVQVHKTMISGNCVCLIHKVNLIILTISQQNYIYIYVKIVCATATYWFLSSGKTCIVRL